MSFEVLLKARRQLEELGFTCKAVNDGYFGVKLEAFIMSSPTLVLYVCLHKCDNVFLFILSRTKGTFTRETERENQSCTISVDTRTPLCHFPLFGFGLLKLNLRMYVQRLANGHAEHPPEFFYTGSLWKASIMRTLKDAELLVTNSEITCFPHIKLLICPSKREVMSFGDFKQRGTLLTKLPKVENGILHYPSTSSTNLTRMVLLESRP
ncbi:hypothetical protein IGI04_016181 [Brassica rapa subsp. trilocularis]|uniref:Uncharacterized protein n=1 Tax=Brassica rapa subsp. trilocularis TaxID=1813537 RepID=A0ABQ7MS89_BRACM|nr:hypothetical protein IGI04_016181 [Brassica rapa subsp. trilocularis]